MASELRVCWFHEEGPSEPGAQEVQKARAVPGVKDRAWKTHGDVEHVLACLAELAGLMDAHRSDYVVKVFVHQTGTGLAELGGSQTKGGFS